MCVCFVLSSLTDFQPFANNFQLRVCSTLELVINKLKWIGANHLLEIVDGTCTVHLCSINARMR